MPKLKLDPKYFADSLNMAYADIEFDEINDLSDVTPSSFIPWNKDKIGIYTEEEKRKISRLGSKHSDETRRKISLGGKGLKKPDSMRKKTSERIACEYLLKNDVTGEIVKIKSLTKFCEDHGLSRWAVYNPKFKNKAKGWGIIEKLTGAKYEVRKII